MGIIPVNDLNKCSVKDCDSDSSVLVQKKMGEEKITFGYCAFHSIISATFFATPDRKEIRV